MYIIYMCVGVFKHTDTHVELQTIATNPSEAAGHLLSAKSHDLERGRVCRVLNFSMLFFLGSSVSF